MALVDGLNLPFMIDGITQGTLTNVQVTMNGGAVDLETFEGFSGKTSGVAKLEISATWAVKISGLEFKFPAAIRKGSYHDVQVPLGGETIISRGYFREGSVGRSVNSATEASCTFVGTFEEPE